MQSKLLVLIAFCCVLIGITSAIVCLPNVCATVDCALGITREACEANGKSLFKPNGGFCGCCSLCVNLLDEGEVCASTLLSLSVPSKVQCREGLRCDPETIRCSKPTEYY